MELLAEDVFDIQIKGKHGKGWSGKTMEGAVEGTDRIEVVLVARVFCGMAFVVLFGSFAIQ